MQTSSVCRPEKGEAMSVSFSISPGMLGFVYDHRRLAEADVQPLVMPNLQIWAEEREKIEVTESFWLAECNANHSRIPHDWNVEDPWPVCRIRTVFVLWDSGAAPNTHVVVSPVTLRPWRATVDGRWAGAQGTNGHHALRSPGVRPSSHVSDVTAYLPEHVARLASSPRWKRKWKKKSSIRNRQHAGRSCGQISSLSSPPPRQGLSFLNREKWLVHPAAVIDLILNVHCEANVWDPVPTWHIRTVFYFFYAVYSTFAATEGILDWRMST